MTPAETKNNNGAAASVEEIQQGWHDLTLRVGQLEAEKDLLEQQNKALRSILERCIEHRQKSHGELVLLLTNLVSKLPINDVGIIVSRLVEHNAHVSEVCAALTHGKVEAGLPQPAMLKALDQTKRDLQAALKPAVEALIHLDTSFETAVLKSFIQQPESFFTPAAVRANRCFIKGLVARERILREFGEDSLALFTDMTTDPKLNPRPKPDEIALAFRSDFETALEQATTLPSEKRKSLRELYDKVQSAKLQPEVARKQRHAFLKMSFILELLHYYENQNIEAPDVVFAQRLPALIEQLALPASGKTLDEKQIEESEKLLTHIISADHRLMAINNVGKGGGLARTLKYVMRLRAEKDPNANPAIQNEIIPDFAKHLIPPPPQKPPTAQSLSAVFKFFTPEMQRPVVRGVMACDRLKRDEAEALGRAIAKELDLQGFEEEAKAQASLAAANASENERVLAWEGIRQMIASRTEPATVATAIRERLQARYEPDEVKQSWVILTESDPIAFIRIFCQLPYLPSGKTDPIARPVMETYVTRLTHEKYAAAYHKISNSLKNMFKANPHSPTLVNFLSLVKWVDPAAAEKMSADIGMAAAVH
ncbi:MAG TPA: hypothetical protein PKA41_16285 [Verrucomicrobiota bacterium]|nr:hypothetical protein [Verrucomicrobiota bacterium]